MSTAKKELNEELGLLVDSEELIELFTQTVDWKWSFRGKDFVDREYNVVYLLDRLVEIKDIVIDKNELSEVIWMNADKVIERLDADDPEYGMNREEFKKSMSVIKEKYLEIFKKSQNPY